MNYTEDFENQFNELKKSIEVDKKLNYFKTELLKIFDKQEEDYKENVEKSLDTYFYSQTLTNSMGNIEKSYGVGKLSTYADGSVWRKISINPSKWKMVKGPKNYNTETHGAKVAIGKLKKQIQNSNSLEELYSIIVSNRDRFIDSERHFLPIVKELHEEILKKHKTFNGQKIDLELRKEIVDYMNSKSKELIKNKDGSTTFGKFTVEQTKAMGIKNAGNIILPVGNHNFGYEHLRKHESQILNFGYKSMIDFINQNCKNFSQIYSAKDTRFGNKTFILLKKENEKRNSQIFLEFQVVEIKGGKNDFVITSSGIFKDKMKNNFKLVYPDYSNQADSSNKNQGFDNSVASYGLITESNEPLPLTDSIKASPNNSVNKNLQSFVNKNINNLVQGKKELNDKHETLRKRRMDLLYTKVDGLIQMNTSPEAKEERIKLNTESKELEGKIEENLKDIKKQDKLLDAKMDNVNISDLINIDYEKDFRIEKCKNAKEVEDLLKSKDWFRENSVFNLDDINIESAKTIFKTYEHFFNVFPIAKGSFGGVTVKDSKDNFFARGGGGELSIEINGKYHRDSSDKDISFNHTMYHEMFHCLESWILKQERRTTKDKGFASYIKQKTKAKYKDKDTVAQLSLYAETDSSEFCAEGFGFAMVSENNNATDFSKEIFKQTYKLINLYKGKKVIL